MYCELSPLRVILGWGLGCGVRVVQAIEHTPYVNSVRAMESDVERAVV